MSRCIIPDCPDRTGGKCWAKLPISNKESVRELRVIRQVYRNFQLDALPDLVTTNGWLMVITPITDRIKALTGGSEI